MSQHAAAAATAPPKPVIFITGASSGLGRAFFQHFAKHPTSPPCTVVGIDRRPWTDNAGQDHAVYRPDDSSLYAQLDVTSPLEAHQALVRQHIGETTPVSLVVHCAGVRGLVPHVPIHSASEVASAETLDAMDAATLLHTYEINVVGTFSVLTAVLPNLRRAARDGLAPKVIVLSSRMGSIAANAAGGGYAYRASKAALNAVLRSMSLDVPEVFFAMVHPGRVETGLVVVKEDGAISVEESLGDVLALLERLGGEAGLGTGCFVDRFGETIQW
ncbi:NAD(P)-binding protein [Cryphonectria parasitica EP155]|uniref:NAD(P)-binding protein n=1 Tax=Cryphonectria parasitica (strain ATCC 38755 / EP155) TaxID=660469 RepID=A0A9P4XXZ8_CRYP1|nr:NAD(P)-binding protein [Cryphonectria parasitica EP155]KAF3762989.1 NAD(P)-binding protein [Cryphonectria parasitica EP155]